MGDSAGQCDFEVRVDSAGREARLVLSGQADPASLSVEAVVAALEAEEVVVSATVRRQVEEVLEAFAQAPAGGEHVVAEAKPAEPGRDGYLAWESGFDPEDTPEEADGAPDNASGEGKQVDFYNTQRYVCVQKDQHIATVVPPEPGVEGQDVCGRAIPVEEGKPLELSVDDTVLIDQAGQVHALSDGVLEYKRGELKITRLLEIREYVDFSTGNISFDGTVNIGQGVRDRFVVKATEDVSVHGLIEAATIAAGGNFTCTRGMVAKDRGQLLIDGDADIGFLNNVRGRIRGNLTVRREAINCDLIVGGDFDIEHGALIGGETVVTGSAKIGTLGSDGGTPTSLRLGSAPLVSAQLNRLNSMVKSVEEEIRQVTERYESLSQHGDKLDAKAKEQLTELSAQIDELKKKLNACEQKREEIQADVGSKRRVDVLVMKIVHPKTTLKIGDREVIFDRELRGPVKIGWDENRDIQYRQGDGPIRSIQLVAREISQQAA